MILTKTSDKKKETKSIPNEKGRNKTIFILRHDKLCEKM